MFDASWNLTISSLDHICTFKNDLFAEEGVWLWENGTPTLSVLRTLALRTLLGPKKEKEINWFLQIGLREKLLGQLKSHLGKIAQIILCCSTSVSNYSSFPSFLSIIF